MAGVPFDPEPLDLVAAHFRIQRLPQVDILDRLAIGRHPPFFLPADDPLGDPLAHILAVGSEANLAGLVQGAQAHDGGHQLHPVISGEPKTGADLFAMLAINHDGTVTARARIAEAGAIRE